MVKHLNTLFNIKIFLTFQNVKFVFVCELEVGLCQRRGVGTWAGTENLELEHGCRSDGPLFDSQQVLSLSLRRLRSYANGVLVDFLATSSGGMSAKRLRR